MNKLIVLITVVLALGCKNTSSDIHSLRNTVGTPVTVEAIASDPVCVTTAVDTIDAQEFNFDDGSREFRRLDDNSIIDIGLILNIEFGECESTELSIEDINWDFCINGERILLVTYSDLSTQTYDPETNNIMPGDYEPCCECSGDDDDDLLITK